MFLLFPLLTMYLQNYNMDKPSEMLTLLSGDPRRPYPTDLEMRSGMLGHMANLPTNGVNGHLPGDALAAGRLPGEFIHRCADVCGSSMF